MKANSMGIYIITFPNCLCFLMLLAVMLHMMTRDATTRVVRELQDGLEVVYCKFPQTRKPEETKRCSSIQSLFFLLANGCSYQNDSREVDLRLDLENGGVNEEEEGEEENVDVQLKQQIIMEKGVYEGSVGINGADEGQEKKTNKKEEETSSTSSLVDSFVIGLLVFSASVSLMEWYKEKNKNGEKVFGDGIPPGEGEDIAAVVVGSRRFSLADLTVNRHLRRKETHQQVVRQASTGGTVVRQGSKPPPLTRRSSFPAQVPEVRSRQPPQRQQSHPSNPPSRRMSVDLAEDDSSTERRRVRIIRRH